MRAYHRRSRELLAAAILGASCLPVVAATPPPFTAPRSTVPILCTDNYRGGRTHARGTGVIVDARGTILTAAHVIDEYQLYCDLTALVPDADWSHARLMHAYSIRDCARNIELDLAVCSLTPISRQRTPLRAAGLHSRPSPPSDWITVTGFSGWGLSPTSLTGWLRSGNYFRKQQDCYCDFSMELTAFEGMSGGPITDADGQVIGILTAIGTGKFRGLAFGVSIERALRFLHYHGIAVDSRTAR